MCAFLRYSTAGLAVLLTTAYVAVSAENGVSAFQPMVLTPTSAETVVNRINKGDRAVTIGVSRVPATNRPQNRPAVTSREQKILEGCDPAFSPLTASANNNFANRCMS